MACFFVLQDPGRNNSSPDGIRAAEIQREELRRLFENEIETHCAGILTGGNIRYIRIRVNVKGSRV